MILTMARVSFDFLTSMKALRSKRFIERFTFTSTLSYAMPQLSPIKNSIIPGYYQLYRVLEDLLVDGSKTELF
jgi:hypothetical protein